MCAGDPSRKKSPLVENGHGLTCSRTKMLLFVVGDAYTYMNLLNKGNGSTRNEKWRKLNVEFIDVFLPPGLKNVTNVGSPKRYLKHLVSQ